MGGGGCGPGADVEGEGVAEGRGRGSGLYRTCRVLVLAPAVPLAVALASGD